MALIAVITEPGCCPECGSDDLGVFAATPEREDEADIVECERCHWDAALTSAGAAALVERDEAARRRLALKVAAARPITGA